MSNSTLKIDSMSRYGQENHGNEKAKNFYFSWKTCDIVLTTVLERLQNNIWFRCFIMNADFSTFMEKKRTENRAENCYDFPD